MTASEAARQDGAARRRIPAAAWVLAAVGLVGVLPRLLVSGRAGTWDLAAVGLALAALAAGAVMLLDRRPGPGVTRLSLAAGAFLAVAAIGVASSGHAWDAAFGMPGSFKGLATYGCIALLAAAAARQRRLAEAIAAVAPWALLMQAGLGVRQMIVGGAVNGSLPNSSYLGELAVLLMPFAYVVAASGPVWRRVVAWVSIASMLVVLAAGGSRIGLLVAGAWLLWAVVRGARSRSMPVWLRIAAVAALLAVALAAGLAFARSEFVGVRLSDVLGGRPVMARLGLRAFAEKPAFGQGPDGYFFAAARNATTDVLETGGRFDVGADPHNAAVGALANHGAAGMLALAWLAWEFARRARRQGPRSATPAAIEALVAYGAVALATPAALHTLPLFGLVLGLAAGRAQEPDTIRPVPQMARVTALGLSVLLVLVAGGLWLSRLSVDGYGSWSTGADALRAQRLAEAWHYDPYLWFCASQTWGYAAGTGATVREQTLATMDRAFELEPDNPTYAYRLARAQRYWLMPAATVEASFRRAVEMYPLSAPANHEFAEFLVQQGRDAEALGHGQAEDHRIGAVVLSDAEAERAFATEIEELGLDPAAAAPEGAPPGP